MSNVGEVYTLNGGYRLVIALGDKIDGMYATEQIYSGIDGLLHIVARRMPEQPPTRDSSPVAGERGVIGTTGRTVALNLDICPLCGKRHEAGEREGE